MTLEIKHLYKSFEQNHLFEDLNMNIQDHAITCIYGASGCGKSTLLNMIGFLEPYDKGHILYDGKEVKTGKNKRKMLRDHIGFIFQDFGLIENETVYDNMLIVKRIAKMKNRRKKIQEQLAKLQLPEETIDRKVYTLSGGEQQRVAIAKIMLKNPGIILADEPTASIDQDNKQIILNMLRQLQQNNKTVIVVSHDKEVVEWADFRIQLPDPYKEAKRI